MQKLHDCGTFEEFVDTAYEKFIENVFSRNQAQLIIAKALSKKKAWVLANINEERYGWTLYTQFPECSVYLSQYGKGNPTWEVEKLAEVVILNACKDSKDSLKALLDKINPIYGQHLRLNDLRRPIEELYQLNQKQYHDKP